MFDTDSEAVVGGPMVDHQYRLSTLPNLAGGAFASENERSSGGVGANVATVLARFGRDVGSGSRVGADGDDASGTISTRPA